MTLVEAIEATIAICAEESEQEALLELLAPIMLSTPDRIRVVIAALWGVGADAYVQAAIEVYREERARIDEEIAANEDEP